MPTDPRGPAVGDAVRKAGGDYRFDGWVVAVFAKRSGAVRIVVEDDRGVLFVARPDQYRPRGGVMTADPKDLAARLAAAEHRASEVASVWPTDDAALDWLRVRLEVPQEGIDPGWCLLRRATVLSLLARLDVAEGRR